MDWFGRTCRLHLMSSVGVKIKGSNTPHMAPPHASENTLVCSGRSLKPIVGGAFSYESIKDLETVWFTFAWRVNLSAEPVSRANISGMNPLYSAIIPSNLTVCVKQWKVFRYNAPVDCIRTVIVLNGCPTTALVHAATPPATVLFLSVRGMALLLKFPTLQHACTPPNGSAFVPFEITV